MEVMIKLIVAVAFFATLLLAGFWASDKFEEYTGTFDEDDDE
jgi:hypothetical protein